MAYREPDLRQSSSAPFDALPCRTQSGVRFRSRCASHRGASQIGSSAADAITRKEGGRRPLSVFRGCDPASRRSRCRWRNPHSNMSDHPSRSDYCPLLRPSHNWGTVAQPCFVSISRILPLAHGQEHCHHRGGAKRLSALETGVLLDPRQRLAAGSIVRIEPIRVQPAGVVASGLVRPHA